jgi:hypothetical protein
LRNFHALFRYCPGHEIVLFVNIVHEIPLHQYCFITSCAFRSHLRKHALKGHGHKINVVGCASLFLHV